MTSKTAQYTCTCTGHMYVYWAKRLSYNMPTTELHIFILHYKLLILLVDPHFIICMNHAWVCTLDKIVKTDKTVPLIVRPLSFSLMFLLIFDILFSFLVFNVLRMCSHFGLSRSRLLSSYEFLFSLP